MRAYYFLLIVILSFANTCKAEDEQPIPFYLPLSSEQFPHIAQQLQSALDQAGLSNFQVSTTDYWHPYQQGLRKGRPGVYFAAPHFSAWAVTRNKFIPILRLKGKLQYVLAARRADSHIFEVNDLAGKTVCTQRAPNLDFLLSRTALKEALILARSKSVNSVPFAMNANDLDCHAFSVGEHIFDQFNESEPFRFIRLYQSEASSNYSFLMDRQTALKQAPAIKKFLRNKKTKSILEPMYKLFSPKPKLVSVRTRHYSRAGYAPLIDYWN